MLQFLKLVKHLMVESKLMYIVYAVWVFPQKEVSLCLFRSLISYQLFNGLLDALSEV